jgi:hypothetical protein
MIPFKTIQETYFFLSAFTAENSSLFSIHKTVFKDFHCILKFSKTNEERREVEGRGGDLLVTNAKTWRQIELRHCFEPLSSQMEL